jgi:hypothetical protein
MAGLPRTSAGYPIPFTTAGDGEIGYVDGARGRRCIEQRLCWCCGQPLTYWLAFIGEPAIIGDGCAAMPPAHPECAAYACQVLFPFVFRRSRRLLGDTGGDRLVVIVCRDYKTIAARDAGGHRILGCRFATPKRIEWSRDGKQISAPLSRTVPVVEPAPAPAVPDVRINIRRHWRDARIGTVSLADLDGIRFEKAHVLIGYTWCHRIAQGRVAHWCEHGEPPHNIKVHILKRDNQRAVWRGLLEKAGSHNPQLEEQGYEVSVPAGA